MGLWIGGFIYLLAALVAMQQRGQIRIITLHHIVQRWFERVVDLIPRFGITVFGAIVVRSESPEAAAKYNR